MIESIVPRGRSLGTRNNDLTLDKIGSRGEFDKEFWPGWR
jgi:hypothetical protein